MESSDNVTVEGHIHHITLRQDFLQDIINNLQSYLEFILGSNYDKIHIKVFVLQ